MSEKTFITAAEIADVCGVSISKAYEIIRNLNVELRKGGYVTLSGKISRRFFNERWYGGVD